MIQSVAFAGKSDRIVFLPALLIKRLLAKRALSYIVAFFHARGKMHEFGVNAERVQLAKQLFFCHI